MISLKIANNQNQQLNLVGCMSNCNKSSDIQHLEIAWILPSLYVYILVFYNTSLKFELC